MNPLEQFLADQVELIRAGDAAGLAARYAEDAELVRLDRVVRGRTAIEEALTAYLQLAPEVLEQQATVTTDDVILYRARQRVGGREVLAVGTFVFRDGLVWRQTAVFLDPSEGA